MINDRSASSIVFDIVLYAVLALLVIVTLFPVLHVGAVSLSESTAISQGKVSIWPVNFTLSAYEKIMTGGAVPRGFVNSVYYTLFGTVISMALTILTAYPLSKKRLPLRGFYTALFMFTMFFGGGMIPSFLLVVNLNIYNTVWALLLPGAISTWNLVILRTFFQAVPDELEEAASIDGANDMTVLALIVLPLSKAALATISLFYAVARWNSWFSAAIYLRSSSLYPLQLILRSIVIQNTALEEMASSDEDMIRVSTESIKYATLFVSIVPMMLVYPFIQKYFAKGVMVGSLKG
ncbi:MAG: carbohydrate ABC transporter permease [Christensenellales bacterium]|jgi:putative aldouronate transport system permease protein